jgi:hypothetical protein
MQDRPVERSRAKELRPAQFTPVTVLAVAPPPYPAMATEVAPFVAKDCEMPPPREYEYEVPAPRTALSAVPKPVAFDVERPPSATLTAVPLSDADDVATPEPVALAPQLAVSLTWMSFAAGGDTQVTGAADATPVPRIAPAAMVAPTATDAPSRVAREELRSERVALEKKDGVGMNDTDGS